MVHGKGSLLDKMPGDRWRKFANLRAYLAFMWTHPGKKLLFMGCELGMDTEWNHDQSIPSDLLEQHEHAAVQMLLRDLNALYLTEGALHQRDTDPAGFQWLVGDDAENSVFAFMRRGADGSPIVAIFNLTPQAIGDYRLGLPLGGQWHEALNSDAEQFGGSNAGNGGAVQADGEPCHGQQHSASVTLPPLGALILRHEGGHA